MIEISVEASGARRSEVGDDAVDVDVVVTVGERDLVGVVTLVAAQYDGSPAAWGTFSNWIEGGFLWELERAFPGEHDFREAARLIESEARGAVPGRWDSGRFYAEVA